MPFSEWIKGDPDPDKIRNLQKNSGDNSISDDKRIVSYRFDGAIEIEEGKTYLTYALQASDGTNSFEFVGVKEGLREVKVDSQLQNNIKNKKYESIMIKKVNTNEYTPLIDLLFN